MKLQESRMDNFEIRGLSLPDLKTNSKATVIKTVWYQLKNRQVDHGNRTESPEINAYIYNQLIFNKSAKIIQRGKNSLPNKWYWDIWIGTYKTIKPDPYFIQLYYSALLYTISEYIINYVTIIIALFVN